MKLKLIYLTLVMFAMFMTGCAGNGAYLATSETNVNLEEANFKIVETNVSGSSSAGYLLGLSFSMGAFTESFALIRVSGTGKQYQEALEDFWNNFEEEHGPAEGRSLGLINVRYDAAVVNTLFYTETVIYVTADVIEYH